ncbi:MAG: S41 family peptidase [Candidatus Muiribacteriota bacterium]
MRRKKILIFCISITLFFVFLQGASVPFTYLKRASMIDEVMKIIQENFALSEEKMEENELIYGAIEGMLKKLDDPYSRFMDPDTFEDMQEETSGVFAGVGIIITNKDEKLMVVSPITGTPAWKAGIEPGDIIFEIDGEPSKNMHTMDATNLIKGPVGTEVTLTILRKTKDGEEIFIDKTIERDNIKVSTIGEAGVIRDSIGYIRINNFGENTGDEFKEEIDKLIEEAQIDSLILDLRSNPGGLLTTAVETVSQLLPAGKNVVSIKGRHNDEVKYPVYNEEHVDIPLIVLINKGSASGSEIVAGAIKDYERGIILGTNSFGKGLVQTVIPLDDGSAIALTTAKYYTPSGESIHGKGIEPDIIVETPEADEDMIEELGEERERNYEKEQERIYEREKGKIIDIEIGKFDNQLKEAVNIIIGAELFSSKLN